MGEQLDLLDYIEARERDDQAAPTAPAWKNSRHAQTVEAAECTWKLCPIHHPDEQSCRWAATPKYGYLP